MDRQGFAVERVFGIAGSALNAQTVRLNTIASNLANVGTEANSEAGAFRAKRTVFEAILRREQAHQGAPWVGGVKVREIVDDQTPVTARYEPGNPRANEEGYVFVSNVNPAIEMVEMLEAARAYENNVEAVNTARQLLSRTLELLRS